MPPRRCRRWTFPALFRAIRHHHEKHPAFVPTAQSADAPAINVIANSDFSEELQKLSLNSHGAHAWLRG
jgi:HD-like signal output (HDOD) protein